MLAVRNSCWDSFILRVLLLGLDIDEPVPKVTVDPTLQFCFKRDAEV